MVTLSPNVQTVLLTSLTLVPNHVINHSSL